MVKAVKFTKYLCSGVVHELLYLSALVLFQANHYIFRTLRFQRKEDSGTLRASFDDVIILIFGAICQQGSPVELKGTYMVLGKIKENIRKPRAI